MAIFVAVSPRLAAFFSAELLLLLALGFKACSTARRFMYAP
jgi:hypothetical protein